MGITPRFLGLDIGDWAIWISAIGTFSAVLVALFLARRDGKRREEDRYARGTVMASFLFADIGIIHRALELAHAELQKVGAAASTQAMAAHIFTVYQIIDKTDTSKLSANMDKVADLPARYAVSLAALPDNVKAIHRLLVDQVNKGASASVSSMRDIADTLLSQIAITKARIDSFMEHFEPKFVG